MSRFHVMVVEDDVWLRQTILRRLADEPWTVSTVGSAIEAIDAIDLQRPDVILLDVFLPGSNGIALLHELRSHSDLASIPAVIMTTNAASITLDDLSPYGVVRVLDKTTMHPDDVVAALRKALL